MITSLDSSTSHSIAKRKPLLIFISAFMAIVLVSVLLKFNSTTGFVALEPATDEKTPIEQLQSPEIIKILVGEAAEEEITVSDQQIDEYIEASLKAFQMSEDELKGSLDARDVSYDQYREGVRSQILISELINDNVDLKSVSVSKSEIDDFIEDNSGTARPSASSFSPRSLSPALRACTASPPPNKALQLTSLTPGRTDRSWYPGTTRQFGAG